jgi:hypothetical protein
VPVVRQQYPGSKKKMIFLPALPDPRARSSSSCSDSLPRCGNSRQVMKKNLSDTTKRRKRDMTPHYTPPAARHAEGPQSPQPQGLCATRC